MKIIDIGTYRDGGTTSIHTDEGEFTIDNKINTETRGAWYKGYPTDKKARLATDKEKAALKYALESFPGGTYYARKEIANG